MNNCDENEIVKFDADFNEDFDYTLINIMGECKRIYFLDSKGYGIKANYAKSIFNKPINLLPANLTHLKFGYSFNQPVENLPFELLWLEFGYCFNQPVNILPNNINYLVFGCLFNQPVNDLPTSLEYVSFGKKFNQSIDNMPYSLQYINIGSAENDYYNGKYLYTEFKQKIHKLPTKINNISIYLMNKKYMIKNDFVNNLNKLL